MRRVLLVTVVAALALALGWWVGRETAPTGETPAPAPAAAAEEGPCPGGARPLYWKAPMDPSYVRDAPGKSPMGMDLVPECPGEGGAPGDAVRIDPALVQSIGVRTAPVARMDLARRIRTVGRVTWDERLVSHVHTKFQGWVERLHVDYEGQPVDRGAPLLEIYSPELVSTQEELLQAARYRDTTARSPFEDVSEGGAQLFEATRRRLELFDIPDRDVERLLETGRVRKSLTVYAPNQGVVTHLMVREGMEVDPGQNLYTIADLSRVWVIADVYENELPWVAAGQAAHVELSYLPGEDREGEVTYVYPFLDPKTRTARVRIELANPDQLLKPDMYANVTIDTEVLEDVLAVPEEAVIRSGTRTLVVEALGEGRFAPRPVELGLDSGAGWVQVREGLREGQRVVTSGQFLLDSESRLREAAQKLLSPAPEAGSGEAAPGAPEAPEAPDAMPGMEHEGHLGPGEPEGPEPAPTASGHEGHGMREDSGPAAEPPPAPSAHEGHALPGGGHAGHAPHGGHGAENGSAMPGME